MKFSRFLIIGAVGLLTACTTELGVQQITAGDFSGVSTGSSYYLPKQAIRVEVTYEVESCDHNGTGTAAISRRAAVTGLNLIDGAARFAVPAESLSSRTKTTALTVGTYDDGMLKSLGVTVDDKAAEITNGLVGATSSIARLVSGAALGQSLACNSDTKDFWDKREKLLEELRDPTKYVDEDSRAAAVDSLTRLNSYLVFVRKITYLPNRAETNLRDRVSREFNTSGTSTNHLLRWLNTTNVSDPDIVALLAITVCILPSDDGGSVISGASNRGCDDDSLLDLADVKPAPTDGLVYRDPRRVRVVVCGERCNSKPIGQGTIALAQFGDWRKIELKSEPFQDRNASATWTKQGQLTSMTIGASSSLEAFAGALNTSAKTITDTVGEIVTTDLERLTGEVATVKAEADLLEQRARLLGLQTTPETEDEEDSEGT